jgi:hypothetical protein
MRHIIAVVALLTSAHLAFAAEPPGIALAERPQLAAGLAAFPRITAPLTPATIKVNAALARADRRALAAAKACTATAGHVVSNSVRHHANGPVHRVRGERRCGLRRCTP